MDNGHVELFRKYRPQKFKDVLGQPEAVKVLAQHLRDGTLPHCLLFCGPSGTGKTTLARIVANKLGCVHRLNLQQINAAESRGIDMVRELDRDKTQQTLGGGVRVWIIDEAHQLTNDAQNGLLTIVEEPPSHCYFFLCSTEPQKLLKTLRTRAEPVELRSFAAEQLMFLLEQTVEREQALVGEFKAESVSWGTVLQRIVEVSEGSARTALVLLGKVIKLPSTEEMLTVIRAEDVAEQANVLFNAITKPKPEWREIAALLQKIDRSKVEPLRQGILTYAKKVLLGQGERFAQAYGVLRAFHYPFHDSGDAGFVKACYEVCIHK